MDDSQVATGAPSPPVMPLALHVRRASGPVVGRQVELGAIGQELASARTGRLTALTLEGEPGIGKTRLLLAAAELAAADGFTALAVDRRRGDPRSLPPRPRASSPLRPRSGTRSNGAREQSSVCARRDLGPRRPGARDARTRSEAPSRVRPGRRRHPRPGDCRSLSRCSSTTSSGPTRTACACSATSSAPTPTCPIFLGLTTRRGGAGRGQRGRDAPRRHGADGPGAPPQARAVHAAGDGRVPPAGARREGQPLERGDHARAGGGRRLHRRGTGPDVPRDGDDPGGRRRVDARPERRAAAPVRRAHADPAPRRPPARRDEAGPRRRGDPRSKLQPPGSPLDQAATSARTRTVQPRRCLPSRSRAGGRGRPDRRAPRRIAPRTTASPTTRSASSPLRCSPPSGGGRSTRPSSTCLPPTAIRRPRACPCSRITRSPPETRDAPCASRSRRPAAALEARAPEEALRIVDQALPAASAAAGPGRAAHLPGRRPSACCAARPTGSKASRSSRRWRRRWATPTSSWTSSSAALLRCACPGTRTGLRSWRGRCARLATSAATARPSSPPAWSWGRTCCGRPLGRVVQRAERGRHRGRRRGLRARRASSPRSWATIGCPCRRAPRARRHLDRQGAAVVHGPGVERGEDVEIAARVAAGETPTRSSPTRLIAASLEEGVARYERAIELFEQVGDRRGVMSAIIARAYVSFGLDIHMLGAARRIEEIRRLAAQLTSLTTGERARHGRGTDALRRPGLRPREGRSRPRALARRGGSPRRHACSATGHSSSPRPRGVALTHLELGELEQAERWLDRAAEAAAIAPTPLRARQLETCARNDMRRGWRRRGDARAPRAGSSAGDGAGTPCGPVRGAREARPGGGAARRRPRRRGAARAGRAVGEGRRRAPAASCRATRRGARRRMRHSPRSRSRAGDMEAAIEAARSAHRGAHGCDTSRIRSCRSSCRLPVPSSRRESTKSASSSGSYLTTQAALIAQRTRGRGRSRALVPRPDRAESCRGSPGGRTTIEPVDRRAGWRPGGRRRRGRYAPALAPDRGADEPGDRGRARSGRGGRCTAARGDVREDRGVVARGGRRVRVPRGGGVRRASSPSRPPSLHRRRELHHDRPHRLRLAEGRLGQGGRRRSGERRGGAPARRPPRRAPPRRS